MRIRRSLPIVLALVLLGSAVAIIVVLRKHAPPEAARLLPGADGFVYLNLSDLRHASLASDLPAVTREPEYEQFVQATGFAFERDLDEAAFAIHYLDNSPAGPTQPRFSEVFVGRFEGDRLRDYLRHIAASVEDYHSAKVYNIALQGRTLRVAILGVDTVAASNHDDSQVIHGMIDRSRKLASPFGGPALLRRYYHHVPFTNRYVPFASLAWAIFRADPAGGRTDRGSLGLSTLFSRPAVVVASVRELSGIHLRAEAFTESEEDAKHVTEELNTFLTMFHSVQSSRPGRGSDKDVKQFFDSVKVQRNEDRALLTATVPIGFIRKALSEGPPPQAADRPPGAAAVEPPPNRKP